MTNGDTKNDALLNELLQKVEEKKIPAEMFTKFNVKRGLRNADGTGVLVGLTEIGDVHSYIIDENEKVNVPGRLSYRGIDIRDIIEAYKDNDAFGFEETIYLLLFGELPKKDALASFSQYLGSCRRLPPRFIEDMILRAPTPDIMNGLARSTLALYSYDDNPDDISIPNVLRQSFELIARYPCLVAYGYLAKIHYYDSASLHIHAPDPNLTTAENFLHIIRPDRQYTKEEAKLLDLALMLHAEHGGGNNSSFTTHVVTSTDTDTYSAISSAVCSLKGPKHGGANLQVIGMIEDMKANIKDITDYNQVGDYIRKIYNKEAYDRSGLVYGMGHAVYTISDPRTDILKNAAFHLAKEKDMIDEYTLYLLVEELAPIILSEMKGRDVLMPANVDLYSGFVYTMLGIPSELFTALFAMSRVVGWCAHRIEELTSGGRIIRPAYKSISKRKQYTPIEER